MRRFVGCSFNASYVRWLLADEATVAVGELTTVLCWTIWRSLKLNGPLVTCEVGRGR